VFGVRRSKINVQIRDKQICIWLQCTLYLDHNGLYFNLLWKITLAIIGVDFSPQPDLSLPSVNSVSLFFVTVNILSNLYIKHTCKILYLCQCEILVIVAVFLIANCSHGICMFIVSYQTVCDNVKVYVFNNIIRIHIYISSHEVMNIYLSVHFAFEVSVYCYGFFSFGSFKTINSPPPRTY